MWTSEEEKRITLIRLTFIFLLMIGFSLLKITNLINWSWFWILTPILVPFLILIFCAIWIIFFERAN